MRVLSFKPQHEIAHIVSDLLAHREAFKDYRDPRHYNIEIFKAIHGETP
jgi:hypothetical protein